MNLASFWMGSMARLALDEGDFVAPPTPRGRREAWAGVRPEMAEQDPRDGGQVFAQRLPADVLGCAFPEVGALRAKQRGPITQSLGDLRRVSGEREVADPERESDLRRAHVPRPEGEHAAAGELDPISGLELPHLDGERPRALGGSGVGRPPQRPPTVLPCPPAPDHPRAAAPRAGFRVDPKGRPSA